MKVKQFEGVMSKSDILKSFMTQERNKLVSQEIENAYLQKKLIVAGHNDAEHKKVVQALSTNKDSLENLGLVLRTMEELLEEYLKEETKKKD